MPLPSNTSLSLLGYSRPGDPLQSKPKQAMLVRLSAETLNALSTTAMPSISVQLGDSPSLFIGDTAFPMRHSEETSIHELFLRASSASKKSAPLKLHANVIGRLAVERELDDEVRDKVRESTQDAAAQRNTRTTMFIENPPDIPNARKRKDPPSNMFHKPTRPSGVIKATPMAASSSLSSSANKPASSTQPQKEISSPTRKRIIQHLSLNGEATEAKLIQILGTSDNPRQLLNQIAEPTTIKTTGNAPKSYRLKPETWKEVRPFEWTIFTEQEQIKIARAARNIFQSLRIPESDPVWQHVHYRSTTSTTQSSDMSRVPSTSNADEKTRAMNPEAAKRGITSKAAKGRIAKPKPDTRGEIMAKDESARAPTRAGQHTEKPIRRPAESPRPEAVTRAVQQTEKPMRRTVESPRPDAPPRSVQQTEKPIRRPAESPRPDVPPAKSQAPHASKSSARPSTSQLDRDPPKAAPQKNRVNSTQARPMDRVSSMASSNARSTPVPDERNVSSMPKVRKMYHEDDRAKMTPTPEREKRPMQTERPKVNGTGESSRDEVRLLKRKVGDKANDERYDPPSQKRRKSEHQPSPSISSTKEDRNREPASTRKPITEPAPPERASHKKPSVQSLSTKPPRKRGESPPPAKRHTTSTTRERMPSESATSSRSQASHAAGSQTSKVSAPAKPRRRSPIYTSSEEEDEPPRVATRPPTSSAPSSAANSTPASHARTSSAPRPLPTDHGALRARYDASYLEYIGSYQRLVAQRGKINRLLKNDHLVGSGTVTDSDGDAELVDLEELGKLTKEYRRLQGELESIQKIFGRNQDADFSPDTLTP